MRSQHFLGLTLLLSLAACDAAETDGAGGAGGFGPPAPLPELSRAPLSTEERLGPALEQTVAARDPRRPEDLTSLLEDGFGEELPLEGEPVAQRTLDGGAPPAAGPNKAMITRFVHLADIQLADDESPARVANLDSAQGLTGGAYRPQEGHGCRILNAAVRTINRLHQDLPIELVILGGDNADNAQENEIDWVTSILSGADSVECDSGEDDDPVAGPANDPKDPFYADGLVVPWVWVMGNHDILNQGNFRLDLKEEQYVSDYAETGTRDWSLPGAPVVVGEIVPDERRRAVDGSAILAKVASDGDGHGISQQAIASGRAFYTHDIPGTNVRFLVVDTAAPTGGAEGVVWRAEVDGIVTPALDQALTEGKAVIVTSHHASPLFTDGSTFGGIKQDDAVLTEEWRSLLGSYPNVLMHLAGHTHHHKLQRIEPEAGYPYWEVETSALVDFPHQMRLVEIWDQDNGHYSIKLVSFDFQVENDPVAAEGRRLGVLDYTSGWQLDGRGRPEDRNVELWVPMAFAD
jgi:hypothetical protein